MEEEIILFTNGIRLTIPIYDKIVVSSEYNLSSCKIHKEDITIKPGYKFYISKETTISRHNIRLLTEKFKCSIVRDINKADFIIINDSLLYKQKKHLYIDYKRKIVSTKYFSKYEKYFRGYLYDKEILEIIKHSDKLVHTNVINSLLYDNVDLPIINEEQYKVLKAMFDSNNKSNIELATTLICNCNLNKSIVYVYILLCDYKWTINNYKLHKNVKFQSLLDYLKETDILSLDENKLLSFLISKNLLTKYYLDAIMKDIKKSATNYIESKYRTSEVKVTLSISDELKAMVLKKEVDPAQLSLFDGN
jgi:hypothetical protein